MNRTLYGLLGYTKKNSSLKSVFLTNRYFENCLIINVEAYDETGYNAINTSNGKFDKFIHYLNRILFNNFSQINNYTDKIRVNVHGERSFQYILNKNGQMF